MSNFKMVLFIIIFLLTGIFSCEKDFETLKITSSTPANNSVGVLPDFYIEIEFNNDVNRTDIEDNFSISGTGDLSGNFQWISSRRFRFTPSDPVTETGRYVMEIPRNVRDKDENIMDTDFISEFYIGSDFTPPSVISSDPPFTNGAVNGIALDYNITVNFSKCMNRESVEKAFSITPDASGYFVWSENVPGLTGSRITYRLSSTLSFGKLYTFGISKSAMDTAGNSLSSDYRVSFITGSDFTLPRVKGIYDASTLPALSGYWTRDSLNGLISRDIRIAVDFEKAMNRTSAESSFSITPSVQGNYEWDSDSKLIFKPLASLKPETSYQIYIDKTAKDINGLTMESAHSVEIKTTAADSLYVRCGSIYGSPDGAVYNLLSSGAPDPSSWPLIITMGAVIPYSQYYYIKIQFVSSLSPYTPVEIKKYSVINNALIETFKSGPGGITVNSAQIVDITWENDSTVIFKFSPMTNKLISVDPPANTVFHSPALYRFSISGGTNGIKDLNGNYAERDIVFEFREAL